MSPCFGRLKSFFATRTPSVCGDHVSAFPYHVVINTARCSLASSEISGGVHTAEEVLVDLLAVGLGDQPAQSNVSMPSSVLVVMILDAHVGGVGD